MVRYNDSIQLKIEFIESSYHKDAEMCPYTTSKTQLYNTFYVLIPREIKKFQRP